MERDPNPTPSDSAERHRLYEVAYREIRRRLDIAEQNVDNGESELALVAIRDIVALLLQSITDQAEATLVAKRLGTVMIVPMD